MPHQLQSILPLRRLSCFQKSPHTLPFAPKPAKFSLFDFQIVSIANPPGSLFARLLHPILHCQTQVFSSMSPPLGQMPRQLPHNEVERLFRNYNAALDHWQVSLLKKVFRAWSRQTATSSTSSNTRSSLATSGGRSLCHFSRDPKPSIEKTSSRMPLSQLSLPFEDSSGVNNVFQTIKKVKANRSKLRSAMFMYDKSFSRGVRNKSILSNNNSIKDQSHVRLFRPAPSLLSAL